MRAPERTAEILFVIGQLEVGGAETHLAAVLPALVRRGWGASIYSLAGDGPLRPAMQDGGVRVIVPPLRRGALRFPGARSLRMAFVAAHLFSVMIRQRFGIVHFFLPEAYLVGAPAAALARIPVRVMSRRSLNRYQSRLSAARFERRLHPAMTAVLGNSRAVIDELREIEAVPAQKLGLIYNGLECCDQLADGRAVRAALRLAPDALMLVTVANLIPYKGHVDILEALALARPDLPADWRLLVVGRDDGIGDQLRAWAQRLGIGGNVLFLDTRSDVPGLLAAADIGLLCSHEEGFSNAVLEGMAAALPMIVTDVGGNPEAVQDGMSGIVVPPRDPARLAEAIVRLAKDAPLRARFGDAARRRVRDCFTLDRCVAQYDALYRTLLAGGLPADVAGVGIACAASAD
jgi:glycosyltransferase involved in cell wall biosynthesis